MKKTLGHVMLKNVRSCIHDFTKKSCSKKKSCKRQAWMKPLARYFVLREKHWNDLYTKLDVVYTILSAAAIKVFRRKSSEKKKTSYVKLTDWLTKTSSSRIPLFFLLCLSWIRFSLSNHELLPFFLHYVHIHFVNVVFTIFTKKALRK